MKSWRDPSEKTLALLLLAPAFFLIALIVIYPVGKLLYNSVFDMQLSGGARALEFVGMRNFADALNDKEFWHAARNTLLITVVTVPGALLVGLGLALLANLPFRFKWVVRLSLLLPWALPLSFCGLIFAWFFTPTTASSTMCFDCSVCASPPCGCSIRNGPWPRFA